MAPTRTLYVDSSYAEVDSSGGRFKLSLPDAIQVPAGSRAYIDDCIFPYSWQTVLAGVNDRAYVLSEKRNGVIWTGAWAFSDPFLAPSDTQLAGTGPREARPSRFRTPAAPFSRRTPRERPCTPSRPRAEASRQMDT